MRYRFISYTYSRKTGPDPLYQNVWDTFHAWAVPAVPIFSPPTDVYETPAGLTVLVELAGLSEEDIQITLFRDSLVVEGERHQELAPSPDRSICHQLGIKSGPFRSEVHIPFPVDQEGVRAEYRNGMLTISLLRLG